MTVAGWTLAFRAMRAWVLFVAFVLPLAMGLSAAEVGAAPMLSWAVLLELLGPGMAAAAVSVAVVTSRTDGSWDGWTALGLSPSARLVPMALCALMGLVLFSGLLVRPASPGQLDGPLALPAPVEEGAEFWFGSNGWVTPDLSNWKTRPGALSTPELIRRLREPLPPGARRGVDRAEVLRRCSGAVLWLLVVPLGTTAALRRTRVRNRTAGAPGISASLEAVAGVLVFQVAALVLAAYASSMT